MVLKPENIRRRIQLVQQIGADNPHGVFLRIKGQGLRPGRQIKGVRPLKADLAPPPDRAQQAQRLVFLQLLADGGLVQREHVLKPGQISAADPVGNLADGERAAVRETVQNIKMQGDILGGEALGLERLV